MVDALCVRAQTDYLQTVYRGRTKTRQDLRVWMIQKFLELDFASHELPMAQPGAMVNSFVNDVRSRQPQPPTPPHHPPGHDM